MLADKKLGFGLVIVVLISLSIETKADQRQKVLDFHAECLDAHGVDESVLIEALEGTVREDEDFFRHLFCAARKAKIMTEDGSVNTANFEIDLKDVIDEPNMANVAALVRKCLIQKDDILTTIREAAHCFMKEDHGL
nr:odorant binding protein 6 [Pagiophloeus tsushimanus]